MGLMSVGIDDRMTVAGQPGPGDAGTVLRNADEAVPTSLSNVCQFAALPESASHPSATLAVRCANRLPHRFRRMAPPLTGKSLILHPPTEGGTP
jgi:hypothetical protein